MDVDGVSGACIPVDDVNREDLETESVKVQLSTNGEIVGELGKASEAVTYVELHLACASEKLVNLSILMMHVASTEGDIEAFGSEKDPASTELAEKAMNFDLLSRILDSGVAELDNSVTCIQTELVSAKEKVSSCKHSGDTFVEMEGKLFDCEKSLKQSKEQLSEIRMQSSKFKRTLSGEEENEDGQSSNANAEIKMQTAEQQRHILRMLEKSLAREMDLEKKLSESRQYEEELKLSLLTSEQELFCRVEEASDVWEKLFEAQNAAEVFMGISKELIGRLQILQFNLNSSFQREAELRSNFEGSQEAMESSKTSESSKPEVNYDLLSQIDSLRARLSDTENKLSLVESKAFALREEATTLEKQLEESESELSNAKASLDAIRDQHNIRGSQVCQMETEVADLKERLSEAGERADNAEAKSELLAKTNKELSEELDLLKANVRDSEKMELLERELKEADMQRQRAVATAEASQEKQNMLYATIGDMDNLIKDLKSKVSKAESRADSAEQHCIILSETNADLNEEARYMRDRLESLELSVHQAEESKMETAKDIGIRAKLITELVMRLAIERQRLHKQISSLASENKRLAVKVQGTGSSSSYRSIRSSPAERAHYKEFISNHDSVSYASENNERKDVAESSEISSKLGEAEDEATLYETEVAPNKSLSDLGDVRTIDADLLSCKHIFMAMLILLLPLAVVYYIQLQN